MVSREYDIPVGNMVLVANSIGAVTASAWVHDYAPRIRAMVLAAPGFGIRLYVPFAIPGLRLLAEIQETLVHQQLCEVEDADTRSGADA